MKRFAIYCFYDQDKIVGEYVYYYLNQLKSAVDYLYVVINGSVLEEYKLRLEKIADRVDERENYGFDAYAYKHALTSVKDDLKNYDELIFSNNSFYGLFTPLDEIFETMYKKSKEHPFDFWGMTLHPKLEARINKKQHYDYINEHVQSYFVVFNRNVFTSDLFLNFFFNLPPIDSFLDAVVSFELELTRVLNEEGNYSYNSYAELDLLPNYNVTIPDPYFIYKDCNFPLVKRKAFFEKYHEIIVKNQGNQSSKLLNELEEQKLYPTEFIWDDLLRTQKLSTIRMNLHLHSILSDSLITDPSLIQQLQTKPKVASIIYIYYQDQVDVCLSYAKNLENIADLYVVCSKTETLEYAKEQFTKYKFKNIQFIKKINKGRDLSSYLIDTKFVFDQYDYVCYFHDKKSPQLGSRYAVREFFTYCMDRLLPTKEFAINVINEFEVNPKLGMLVVPSLNWGAFYCSEYNLNPKNKELMKDLIKDLNLNVPFDEYPVAPYGDYFWIRSKAIKPLYNKQWTYDELPDEPLDVDGTILHALERIIPFCVQSASYYTSWIDTTETVKTYTDNCYYYSKTFNETMFKIFRFCDLVGIKDYLKRLEQLHAPEDQDLDPDRDPNDLEGNFICTVVKNYEYLRAKYRKYQWINWLTFGLVKKFRERKKKLHNSLRKTFGSRL